MLPEWFGIAESNEQYAATAELTPAVVATVNGIEVGLLTLVKSAPRTAEIDVLAVAPEYHRRGIGRAMLDHAERLARRAGVEQLEVKTLSASAGYEPYERTRAFYEACGFRVKQELPDLWGPDNPAVALVKRLER